MTAPNDNLNTNSGVTNTTVDTSFDDFCDEFEGKTSSKESEQPQDEYNNHDNDDVNNNTNNTVTINNVSSNDEPSNQGEATPTKESSSSKIEDGNSTDYEALYTNLKREHDAKIGLLQNRLQDLSSQYQELKKQSKDTSGNNKKEKKPTEVPNNIKEIMELYPDVMEAVDYIVAEKARDIVDTNVSPIREQLAFTEQQKHEAAIRRAHPDVSEIMASGDLVYWMNNLSPMLRIGAQEVYSHGSTDDVISLIDEYKKSRGIKNEKSSINRPQSSGEVLGRNNDSGYSDGVSRPSVLQSGKNAEKLDNGSLAAAQRQRELYGESVLGTSDVRPSYGDWTQGNERNGSGRLTEQEVVEQATKKILAALAVETKKEPINISTRGRKKEKTFDDFALEYERTHRKH